jgi:hypothetical protein
MTTGFSNFSSPVVLNLVSNLILNLVSVPGCGSLGGMDQPREGRSGWVYGSPTSPLASETRFKIKFRIKFETTCETEFSDPFAAARSEPWE